MSPRYISLNPMDRIMKSVVYKGFAAGLIKDSAIKSQEVLGKTMTSWTNSEGISEEFSKTFYANTQIKSLANKYLCLLHSRMLKEELHKYSAVNFNRTAHKPRMAALQQSTASKDTPKPCESHGYFRFDYSHMAHKDREESKLVVMSTTTGSVVRKVDALGACVVSVCSAWLKSRSGDGQLVNEFMQEMRKLRRAHTVNRTMKNSLSKSYKSFEFSK
eukprot:TRINITY_DN12657_c0_g2_i4.p1 TRINITY_DN12657_c0_g2~~TRINITY_DN12657_c0_g2_i4.p1  ORF type:complete len:217 (-),score=55.68 TRINITY_DN12657_c0_g2_i4:137-787(-)